MHLLCNDESVIGRAFFVMAFVEGRVLWDPALPGMTAGDRGAHYDEMNRVIAALHATPVEGAIAAFGRHGNYFLRQIGRWSRQYLASATESIDAMDRLIAWLPAHLPLSALDDNENAVVHGDFRLDNLIFHACEPRVVAVLDWELSTIGHPLADISYHCMAWHIPPGVFRGLGGLDLKALGVPEERDYLRRYCERTGRSDRVDALMNDWNFYLAYNLFRLASITQGIARRVLDGTASSAQARASGAATRALAALAWAFAQGAAAAH
jgi:aminoglycoside phosphotransferase (APT) family kinase protein